MSSHIKKVKRGELNDVLFNPIFPPTKLFQNVISFTNIFCILDLHKLVFIYTYGASQFAMATFQMLKGYR